MSTFSIIISVLILAAVLLFASCKQFSGTVNKDLSDNYYYNRDKSAIQYSPMGNWFELGNTKMEADVASFEVLGRDYGKDKDKVYFKSVDITGEVDYATFRVDDDYFVYDHKHVYIPYDYMPYSLYEDTNPTKELFLIEGADPSTFETIDYDWNKDDKHYFYNCQLVDVDYASFEILNEVASKDKNKVYLHRTKEIITSTIDVASAKALDKHYIVDKNTLYSYSGWEEDSAKAMITIPVKDARTIQLLKDDYLLVDDAVYYENVLMPKADRATFKLWKDTYYGVDKAHIYYLGTAMEGVDLETFHVYDFQAYAKDKNNAFYDGKVMEGVDLATFGPKHEDGFGLFKDKNHIYRGAEIVTD